LLVAVTDAVGARAEEPVPLIRFIAKTVEDKPGAKVSIALIARGIPGEVEDTAAEIDAPARLRQNHRWCQILRGQRVGAAAGAEKLGATLYEVDPGGRVSPLHIHHANEELLIVLTGRPTLRTAEGERELVSGEVVTFPAGRRGAHQVLNRSGEGARVLMHTGLLNSAYEWNE